MTWNPRTFSRRMLLAGLACVLVLPAAAQQRRLLEGPRAAGQAGERYDGYAAVHGAAPAEVHALVEQVNAHRRQIYGKKAVEQKVPADAIGRIYAGKIMQRLPAGTWLLREDGRWVQK